MVYYGTWRRSSSIGNLTVAVMCLPCWDSGAERGARGKKQEAKHDVKWDAVKNREVGILGLFVAEYGAYS